MEAIIRHSHIPRNGPTYKTYCNSPDPVYVYCSCCAKGSKAKSTVPHADLAARGSGGFCLPVLAARHEHVRFSIRTQKKRLPIIPSRILKNYGCGLAQHIIKISFLGGRVECLPIFTASKYGLTR